MRAVGSSFFTAQRATLNASFQLRSWQWMMGIQECMMIWLRCSLSCAWTGILWCLCARIILRKSRRFSLSISLLFAQATTSRLLRLLQLNDGRHNLQFQASCCSAFLIEACYLMLALVRESIVYCEIMCMKPEPLCPSKFSLSLILILNQRTSHCTLGLGRWMQTTITPSQSRA